MNGTEIMFSVCIATRDEKPGLALILEQFQAISYGFPWELVIVVNQTNKPGTAPVPHLQNGTLSILHEPARGKANALNKALSVAKGRWLLFTDDDVSPKPDWLTCLHRAIDNHPDARVIGSKILPVGDIPTWILASSNLREILLSHHDLGDEPRWYGPGRYPLGPNMGVLKTEVASRNARWNPRLGPGTALPVGDETAFLAQVSAAADCNRLYVPDAVVTHRVNANYLGTAAAMKRAYQGGLAYGKLVKNETIPPTPLGRRAQARITGLRSLRELLCILARAIGAGLGRLSS